MVEEVSSCGSGKLKMWGESNGASCFECTLKCSELWCRNEGEPLIIK
jgi:hypothetical protein